LFQTPLHNFFNGFTRSDACLVLIYLSLFLPLHFAFVAIPTNDDDFIEMNGMKKILN
jgi:hypothetical protein